MVVDQLAAPETDRLFHALADATRRDILRRTLGEPLSVSALAADYTMSFAAVQKHVAVLATAQLVTKRRHGREQLVRAEPRALGHAGRLLADLESLWRGRVGRMQDLLDTDPNGGPTR